MKSRSTLISIALCLFLTGCASHQRVMNKQSNLSALDSYAQRQLNINWSIAEEILGQDAAAWIASDSIQSKLSTPSMQKIKGYIAKGNPNNGSVLFFSLSNNGQVNQIARLSFVQGRIQYDLQEEPLSDSALVLGARSLLKSREMNQDYITTQKARYNEYLINRNNRAYVYMMPGNTETHLIMGGGIKTEFDGNRIASNIRLHKSIIPFPISQISDINARSSSVTDIPNEIDIAQYLLNKHTMYNQMIMAKKYTVFFYYIPKEDRVAVQALTNTQ